ncbi:hypothetical protein [Clostridium sp. DJ247]|uniref:hypothetical protein n=1 Tax=Clostridium sp. DJ247 TaxID=2726188 RepID=UPI00162504E8|nr:hypothetical protein [Clostridium sp. DJ247]MBC2582242.1 hypothetical protein [Clostridium sp. DJ247]
MFLCKKIDLTERERAVENLILNWSLGHERFLNVISLPYNSSEVFLKTILFHANKGKKIIYITNEEHNHIDILETIKRSSDFRDYSYTKYGKINLTSRLKVCDFINAKSLSEKFDVIIYDEIRRIPKYNKHEVIDLVSCISNNEAKVIFYSVEGILENKKELIFPINYNRTPMVEPRSIVTRVNINKDIPFVVYDYLKWSIMSDRKVVIYVPTEEKIESVYSYISYYCKEFSRNIICCVKSRKDKKQILNFEKIKRAVLITNDFEQNFLHAKNTDVMVYFADAPEYDYKKLIYFCGSVGRSEKDSKGEVIFLANEETDHMEKAKNIARNFNKEAWEMGLLRI